MITYLINQKTKEKAEVLDDVVQFVEEGIVLVPLWGGEMFVTKITHSAKIEGDPVIGLRASIIQNVFVNSYEENQSTVN